jgi:lipopolysaccharide/colanic/teichoic acid biosynthesis glycosyltransferase
MHNEEHFIARKIINLASLDYPSDKFKVILLDDGSTDHTVQLAQTTANKHPQLNIKIESFPVNQGKVALLNHIIPTLPDDCILFFSDVSSSLSQNILHRANAFFNNPKVGAFSAKYILAPNSLKGEKAYWNYQSNILSSESTLGSPMGYHGAGYAIRKNLWEALPVRTINEDFIVPMRIIGKGYLGVYDKESSCLELELSSEHIDWNRRIRIAKGNIQQVYYLKHLLLPHNGFLAWMFLSSKTLRIFIPWLLILLFLSSLFLICYLPILFLLIVIAQLLFYLTAFIHTFFKINTKFTNMISYFVRGQITMLMGWFKLIKHSEHWKRANKIHKSSFVPPIVRFVKWIMDKLGALVGLSLALICFPLIALLIKRSSPGPIFYKQLRVGRSTEQYTQLFYVYKFRTMNINADKSPLKWTMENDPRIYPFGEFLRKTHLDELPQFFNVLKGDMSLVGPRPERPGLYPYIEKNVPFYSERLYGLLPGITGLAQVNTGSDHDIDDVKRKVCYDHAYAIHLTKPWLWFKLEILIIFKTIKLVLLRKEV